MIDLLPDETQQALIDGASSFLGGEVPRDRLARNPGSPRPLDAGFLRRCGELGLFGLALDEAHGGVGLTMVEEVLVFRELGRHLVPGPFVGTVLAAKLAAEAGDVSLAQRLVTGDAPCGLAEIRPDGRALLWDGDPLASVLVVDVAVGTAGVHARDALGALEPWLTIDPRVPAFLVRARNRRRDDG